MKKAVTRNLVPLIFSASAVAVLLVVIFTSSVMKQASAELEYNTEQRLLALAKAAANMVTAEELDSYWQAEDMDDPEYWQIKQQLDSFAQEAEIWYVYYLRPVPDMPGWLQFVIDNVMDEEEMDGLNSAPVEIEPAPQAAFGGVAACAGLGTYSENWEGYLAAYAPVYDSRGNIYCIAGVDMSDSHIVNAKHNIQTLSFLMFVVMAVVILTGFLTFILYRKKAVQAESASEAKSLFLSRMSHEIRTPMNAIIGFSRMAHSSEDVHEIKSHLDSIDTASAHLLSLVNDVLDISKIESGKMKLEEVAIELRAEVDRVKSIINAQAQAKNQQFEVRLDPAIPKYLYCDYLHFNQVLVNLLSNAVKFTPPGGSIWLEAKLLDSRDGQCNILWSVRDTGIGIDSEAQGRLFRPFEQADGSTTRKYGGTGLGLSISKQLVEMMGGRINVSSVPGKGSEFYFDVWLRIADRAREHAQTTQVDLAGKHILLVEDSEINRIVAEDVFQSLGATNDYAPNGKIGVEMFAAMPKKYDYIFMDIQMPVMDGYEAARQIRMLSLPQAQRVPIIAMTANVFREDVDRAKAAGMDAHVGKPFEVEQIRMAVADATMARSQKS